MKINSIIIGAPSSSSGKTTISIGIMRALSRRLRVQPFKVGPDYIDPGYHNIATGRFSSNLDTWMSSREKMKEIFIKRSTGSDISIIEGVMGLYDGKQPDKDTGSTAEVARTLKSPVIIVIDISAMARTAAAIILGLIKMDKRLRISGVILNNAGSDYHCSIVRTAIEKYTGIPVIGCVKRSDDLKIDDRYLGLKTAMEDDNSGKIDKIADIIERSVDLDLLIKISKESGDISFKSGLFSKKNVNRVRIAIAYDAAFNFYYYDNIEMLKMYGAEIVYFSPLNDYKLPEADGLYIGGGFPELFAERLSDNYSIKKDIMEFFNSGRPVFAECGGYMYLSRGIKINGKYYEMASIINGESYMDSLILGYRNIRAESNNILMMGGWHVKGHEFHYSRLNVNANAYKTERGPDGISTKNLLAGYMHLYFPSNPRIPERFVRSCYNV
ncbi:cobyrinate a,c-diamide synthase [Picrophilus oshimae]|uniref:Cobyrinate a,c-diamide synthase n=1 Tax=Picrophilus torridus (strain ATCC 700027 / DSM 9790 / JCM 10055 / NBRC 100828 / KAW 2/3) TaxID=1122961 RepID=CBIA_PICTO|nr:cobyrinate a,c-diamide synthase [Picrophilus oshimae]Q6L2V8.1 RecName: Full=Cobyrinate a,c-diamide synthase; AltName: Full=Cobyrinic acid a,c-diamide synthetase [Picrophilus oshimae DSM 9789]AAT42693.1 cobyrinic acid a,c-diamide synthase [Picrophilus oshimae DSM 9789]